MPTGRTKSTTTDDDLMLHIKLALSDDVVIETLASRIAEIVADKINNRIIQLEMASKEKMNVSIS